MNRFLKLQGSLFDSPRKHLSLFLEQIATLLEAGLPIDIAFRSMGRDNHSGYFPDMAIATAARLEKGELLSDILEDEDKIFNTFDIAIIDIRLGNIDGIELGHHLLSERKVRKILFISADDPGRRLQQFAGKTVRVLRKPISLSILEETLSSLQNEV